MKRILIPFLLALTLLAVTGCAGKTEPPADPTMSPTANPTPIVEPLPDMAPDATMATEAPMPGEASAAPAGVTSAADARRIVEQIEEELELLSEVDEAQVVLVGNTAAVALDFDEQYQGGVDERLRGIVQERIDGVVEGITEVTITEDKTFMEQLEALGDKLDGAIGLEELRNELNAIINKITATMA